MAESLRVALSQEDVEARVWAEKARGLQNRLQGHFGEFSIQAIAAAAGLSIATFSLDFGIDILLQSLEGDELRLSPAS